jgi:hypothetical protein
MQICEFCTLKRHWKVHVCLGICWACVACASSLPAACLNPTGGAAMKCFQHSPLKFTWSRMPRPSCRPSCHPSPTAPILLLLPAAGRLPAALATGEQ